MIIGLVGKKFSGKDTCAGHLIVHYHFKKLTFAQALKDVCQYLFLLSDQQLHDHAWKEKKIDQWGLTPREIMQKVGTDLFRNHFDKDFWLKQFQIRFDQMQKDGPQRIVCSDCRYQNEVDLIKKLGGVIIRIDRDLINDDDEHESEKLNIQHIDYTICNNDSLESLYAQIDAILAHT